MKTENVTVLFLSEKVAGDFGGRKQFGRTTLNFLYSLFSCMCVHRSEFTLEFRSKLYSYLCRCFQQVVS